MELLGRSVYALNFFMYFSNNSRIKLSKHPLMIVIGSISHKAGLVVMNSLSFCLGKSLSLFCSWRTTLPGSIPGWHVLFFYIKKIILFYSSWYVYSFISFSYFPYSPTHLSYGNHQFSIAKSLFLGLSFFCSLCLPFVLFLKFHIWVRSYGICLSLTYFA